MGKVAQAADLAGDEGQLTTEDQLTDRVECQLVRNLYNLGMKGFDGNPGSSVVKRPIVKDRKRPAGRTVARYSRT